MPLPTGRAHGKIAIGKAVAWIQGCTAARNLRQLVMDSSIGVGAIPLANCKPPTCLVCFPEQIKPQVPTVANCRYSISGSFSQCIYVSELFVPHHQIRQYFGHWSHECLGIKLVSAFLRPQTRCIVGQNLGIDLLGSRPDYDGRQSPAWIPNPLPKVDRFASTICHLFSTQE